MYVMNLVPEGGKKIEELLLLDREWKEVRRMTVRQ